MLISLSTMKPVVRIAHPEGQRVRYTGDMANASGHGVIHRAYRNAWNNAPAHDVVLTDGRLLNACEFIQTPDTAGPGDRLITEEGIATPEEIAALLSNATAEADRKLAEQAAAQAAFATTRAKIMADNPKLITYEQAQAAGRKLYGVTLAAHNLRTLLKQQYPGTKFRVTTEKYSGGNSMTVRWTDGPTTKAIDALADRFSGGSFNGMEDIYENHDSPWHVFGEARYIHTYHEYSDAVLAAAIARAGYADQVTVEQYRTGYADRSAAHWINNALNEQE